MSLLNTILGAAGSMMGGQQQQANPLLNIVLGMLANQGGNAQGGNALGGLAGLMGQMQNAGLGNVIQSWIGKGDNLPINPQQLQSILGSGQIGQIAQQLGLSEGDTSNQLAQLLPEIIDKLTPDGEVPQQGLGNADQMMNMLGALLKR